jgi:predicted O-methyltransferase YrrM
VFIDGHHDEQATWDYFNQIEPALADGAVVVFDDIAWSQGMRRVWRRVAADPRMAHACDLRHLGVCIYRRPSGAAC